jgi:hypothetical protein
MKLYKYIAIVFLFGLGIQLNAQYISVNDGDWNDPSIWNLNSIPTSASGTITVNHNVSVPFGYSVTIDQTTVNGEIEIDPGGQVTLADGTGVDLTMNGGSILTVYGTFIRNNLSTITQNVTSSADFNDNSIYRHRYQTTEGVPPLATWDEASNFYLEGFTNTSLLDLTSSAWNQNFGNFIYNCTGQRSIVSFNGLVTNIQGDLSFLSTGTNLTRLTDNEVNVTITVAGNLAISGTSRVNFSEDGTGGILNLNGNWNHTSTSTLGSTLTNTGGFTVNLTGNFIMNANTGRIFMAGSGGATGTSTINLFKNFTLTSGTITESGTGTANGNLRFIGNGSFNFVNSGSILNLIHYYIAPTVTLNLGIYPIQSGTNSTLTVDGATLICGSLEPTGAIRTTTTLGNIRTPNALRTYVAGTVIIYRSASAQFMGDGQPTSAVVTTIIDNAQGVTLYQGTTATLTINGTLQLENGMLFIGARTLSLTGTVSYNTGTFGGNTSSVLLIGGTTGGSFGELAFNPANDLLGTLTLNRTGAGGSVDVNSTLIINSQLNLTNGSINNNSGLTAGNGCVVTRFPTAFLLVNRLDHAVGDLYDVTYRTASTTGNSLTYSTALELPATADVSALNNLIINTGQSADIVELTQHITASGNITLSRGSFSVDPFNITMQGTTWSDNGGTFVPGTGVVIFNGTTTITGTSNPVFGNIQLTTGNSLTIGRNTSISGDIGFQAASTFDPGIFTITLNGSTLQTLSPSGANFFNLTMTKGGNSDVALTSAMGLLSVLRFNNPSANCDFQSNGFLTLISTSDAAGTATVPNQGQIYRLASGNQISGDITVQRYMSGEDRIYRYLSSPVSDASVAQWQDDFPITGTFTNPSSAQTICGIKMRPANPSLFYYDENVPGDINTGYVAYPASGMASANPLLPGVGYAAFIRQCIAPTLVDVTGTANQGTFTFNISYTNTGDPTADGYNLVGNPYPCTIDWDAGWTKTRISNIISVQDNGSGLIRYWDGTTGDLANGLIAPGQAFWVRATAASPILRASENTKVITPVQAGEFYREAQPVLLGQLTISLSDGTIKDKAFLKLRPASNNSLDDWDAPKLNNEMFDLYSLNEGVRMAINASNNIDDFKEVQLGIKDLSKGNYSLKLEEISGEYENYAYMLIDRYTHNQLIFTNEYKFVISDDPSSSREDRFLLKQVSKDSDEESIGFIYPMPVDRFLYVKTKNVDQISMVDNLGKDKPFKAQVVNETTLLDLEDYASGIYYLNYSTVDGNVKVYKVIKK